MRQITFIILLFLFIHEGYSQQDTIYTYVFFDIGKKPDENQKKAERMLKDNFDVYFHKETKKCEQIFRLFKKDNLQEAIIEQDRNNRRKKTEVKYNPADFYMKGTISKYDDYYFVKLEAIAFDAESKGTARTTIAPSSMNDLDDIQLALDTLMKQLTNDSRFGCHPDCTPFRDTSDGKINCGYNIRIIKRLYKLNVNRKNRKEINNLLNDLSNNLELVSPLSYGIVMGYFYQYRKRDYGNAGMHYNDAKRVFCESNNYDKIILNKLKEKGVIRFKTNNFSEWLDARIDECENNIK